MNYTTDTVSGKRSPVISGSLKLIRVEVEARMSSRSLSSINGVGLRHLYTIFIRSILFDVKFIWSRGRMRGSNEHMSLGKFTGSLK